MLPVRSIRLQSKEIRHAYKILNSLRVWAIVDTTLWRTHVSGRPGDGKSVGKIK